MVKKEVKIKNNNEIQYKFYYEDVGKNNWKYYSNTMLVHCVYNKLFNYLSPINIARLVKLNCNKLQESIKKVKK